MLSKIEPRWLAAGIALAIVTVGLAGLALHYGSAEQRDALAGAIVATGVMAGSALRSWLRAKAEERPSAASASKDDTRPVRVSSLPPRRGGE